MPPAVVLFVELSKHDLQRSINRMDRPHWSYSHSRSSCVVRFNIFRAIVKYPKPFLPRHGAGSAVHQSLAEYPDACKPSRLCPEITSKRRFWPRGFKSEGEKKIQYRDGDDRNKMLDQGVALLNTIPTSHRRQRLLQSSSR